MLEAELVELRDGLLVLSKEVSAMRKDISGLIDAWHTANGMARFVKWLATVATAAAVLWALTTGVKS